jgi:hypothetical protein
VYKNFLENLIFGAKYGIVLPAALAAAEILSFSGTLGEDALWTYGTFAKI